MHPTKGGRVHQRKGGGGARSLEDAGEGSSRRVREHVRGWNGASECKTRHVRDSEGEISRSQAVIGA
jgi:hypothetical protein